MMLGKDDLGLSLSLNFPQTHEVLPQNNKPMSPTSSRLGLPKDSPMGDAFYLSDTNCLEARSSLRGIDVNGPPSSAHPEDEAGVSSPNSTVSSVCGKRSEREPNGDDHECSRGISDEEDGDTSRKKLRLSKDQAAVLEETFKEHNTLNPKQKLALAKQLGLRPRQVEVWFQNRRARTKLKQTEVDCEFLRRCCENLTEENRRLQKEVAELRSLKLSPHFYKNMAPPTTLTMCPSCERVSGTPSSTLTDPRSAYRSLPMNPWSAMTRSLLEPLRPRS